MNDFSGRNVGNLTARREEGNRFTDTTQIPWTSFFINGTDFKLLNFDGERATILVKIEKGARLAIHRHLQPVELYLFEGSFGYADPETGEENWIKSGGYLYEPPGTVHEPMSPDGLVGIAFIHGPLLGYADDGTEVIVGPKEYYMRAKENNAVSHLNYVEE